MNTSSVRQTLLAGERGELPVHKAGRHRRVLCTDLMAFKAASDRASGLAMETLARQAQDLRLGYE